MTGHQPHPGVDMAALGMADFGRISIEAVVRATADPAGVREVLNDRAEDLPREARAGLLGHLAIRALQTGDPALAASYWQSFRNEFAQFSGGSLDTLEVGRYEILGQIGKGAMGVVYKGRDPKLQRLTAIKTIRFGDDFDEDEAFDEFFTLKKAVAGTRRRRKRPNVDETIYRL